MFTKSIAKQEKFNYYMTGVILFTKEGFDEKHI